MEYRLDDQEQPDTTFDKRTTWLLKNSLKYQLDPDWRLLGQFNYSHSTSSQGDFYDGSFTEAVLGWAYRPVAHDRLMVRAAKLSEDRHREAFLRDDPDNARTLELSRAWRR